MKYKALCLPSDRDDTCSFRYSYGDPELIKLLEENIQEK